MSFDFSLCLKCLCGGLNYYKISFFGTGAELLPFDKDLNYVYIFIWVKKALCLKAGQKPRMDDPGEAVSISWRQMLKEIDREDDKRFKISERT